MIDGQAKRRRQRLSRVVFAGTGGTGEENGAHKNSSCGEKREIPSKNTKSPWMISGGESTNVDAVFGIRDVAMPASAWESMEENEAPLHTLSRSGQRPEPQPG